LTVTAVGKPGAVARITTFTFTARPSADQREAIARHMGARRFAWNQSLRLVLDARDQNKSDPTVEVPRTAYSLINAINGWKRSEEAGRRFVVGTDGETTVLAGLPWRHQVCAQVFEEAAVDLSRALATADKAQGTKRRVGFPRFQKKGRCTESFRLRNKVSKQAPRASPLGGPSPVRSPCRCWAPSRCARTPGPCDGCWPRARMAPGPGSAR
jgi:putative transposase